MRISDWSSDVCSSDLTGGQAEQQRDREQMAHDGFLLIVMVAAWYDSRPCSPLPAFPRRRFAPICRIPEALLEMIDEQSCAQRQVAAFEKQRGHAVRRGGQNPQNLAPPAGSNEHTDYPPQQPHHPP